jgi:hypothetical protein
MGTGAWAPKAKVWDAATGRELASLQGQLLGANGVAVPSDGQRVAVGTGEGTIKMFMFGESGPLAVLTLRCNANETDRVFFPPQGPADQASGIAPFRHGRKIAPLISLAHYASHPEESTARNFGETCRRIAQGDGKDIAESFERRFRRLLACDRVEDIIGQLRSWVRLAASKGTGVNYESLFADLWNWSWYADDIRVTWAKSLTQIHVSYEDAVRLLRIRDTYDWHQHVWQAFGERGFPFIRRLNARIRHEYRSKTKPGPRGVL